MSLVTVARPYARAVFDHAMHESQGDAWAGVLGVLKEVVQNKVLKTMIQDPSIKDDTLCERLLALCVSVDETSATALGKDLEHFLTLLIQQNRVLALVDIANIYQQLLLKKAGVLPVEVSAAFLLTPTQKTFITTALEKKFKSQVLVSFVQDNNLIAGIIVRTEGVVIDGSVKGQLDRLVKQLRG